jgi:succinate-acetate transporter protein
MFPMFGIYLAGANTLGFLVAVLLCARASKQTEDVLFVGLGVAFALLAVNQFVIAAEFSDGSSAFGHLLRFAAFAISLAAVVYGNYLARAPRP